MRIPLKIVVITIKVIVFIEASAT